MKKIIGKIKLRILSGKASPAPPIGPALGQKGLNINEFCKNFNNDTAGIDSIILPVLIIFYSDKTYDYFIKKPSINSLIKKYINVEKFSSKPKLLNNLNVDENFLKSIVSLKISDMNTNSFYSAYKVVLGVIKSMGINVK